MMKEYDFVVLGAGVAGLSFAYEVSKHGKTVIILEKDKQTGGLSRTLSYNGFRFDYCAHRFHSANKELLEEVKYIVGSTFKKHIKKSRIFMFNKYLKYPFELQNLLRAMRPWQAIYSIFSFGFNYIYRLIRNVLGIPKVEFKSYKEWFVYYFGKALYSIMCEPYTSKIWKIDPSKISADWAEQRFQGIRLIELMKTILIKLIKLDFSSYSLKDDSLAPDGGEFYYGETGAQEIPDGFTRILKKNGALILTKVKVKGIKVNSREVEFIYNGELKKIIACEKIVSTIPLHDLYEYIDRKESSIGRSLQEGLEYMNIIFVYLLLNKDHVSNDHWLYFPDRDIVFNRSVEFKNWSDQMCPDGKTAICLDITCFEGDELWTLSKEKLVERCIKDVEKVNLIEKTDVFDSLVLKIKNAYPYYDLDYMTKLQNIIKFIESNGCILCLGRTGRFYYTNSDGSIEMGMDLAKRLVNEESGVSALDWEIRKVSY